MMHPQDETYHPKFANLLQGTRSALHIQDSCYKSTKCYKNPYPKASPDHASCSRQHDRVDFVEMAWSASDKLAPS